MRCSRRRFASFAGIRDRLRVEVKHLVGQVEPDVLTATDLAREQDQSR
jgi:hypothetical protein